MSNIKGRGEIEIPNVVKASGKIIKKRKMNFSEEEECTIRGKQILTDESINIAQSLLSKQFLKVCSFQNTVIGKLQEFDVIPTGKSYIQILHDSSLHWVCLAIMESRKKDKEIHYLYDSISKDITAYVERYYCTSYA